MRAEIRIRVAAAILAVALAAAAVFFFVWSPRRSLPLNVVIISLTDVRADHLGLYGYERDTSPNLDAFAKDAVVFEQAVLQGSRSPLSLASLFSAQYPRAHGVVFTDNELPDQVTTMAEALKERGYATAAFVSDGQQVADKRFGLNQGFDTVSIHAGTERDPLSNVGSWIEKRERAPFFLFFDWNIPSLFHASKPLEHRYASPEYDGVFADHRNAIFSLNMRTDPAAILPKLKRTPAGVVWEAEEGDIPVGRSDLDHLVDHYDGGVRAADEFFGLLVDMLKRGNAYDNSIIIVFSSHGESLDDHVERRIGPLERIQLTGHAQVFEEVIRTPFLFRHPRMQGRRIAGQAEMIDVFPTVLDVLSVFPSPSLRDQMQGESLLSAMRRGKGKEIAFGQSDAVQNIMFARSFPWKLVRWPDGTARLYNLREDPGETADVSERHPDIATRLIDELEAWNRKNILKRIGS